MASQVSATPPPTAAAAVGGGGVPPENANEGCVGPQSDAAGKAAACDGCPNQSACASGALKGPVADEDADVAERMKSIKHTVLVLSGKGGVGKSTVSSQLAFTLAAKGFQVGLLDIDICGPSIPRMLGALGQEVHRSASGWSPVWIDDNLGVMSIGFMLPDNDAAVVWRGPKKHGLIKQFLSDVEWGTLDFLIIDTPPGTSDEHISITSFLKRHAAGAVVVTTPQEVAMMDVRKELNFCVKVGLPILGVIANQSGFVCPCCDKKTDIFPVSATTPAMMAAKFSTTLLGELPIDPQLGAACEAGEAFTTKYPKSPAAAPLESAVAALLAVLEAPVSTATTAAVAAPAPAPAPVSADVVPPVAEV